MIGAFIPKQLKVDAGPHQIGFQILEKKDKTLSKMISGSVFWII